MVGVRHQRNGASTAHYSENSLGANSLEPHANCAFATGLLLRTAMLSSSESALIGTSPVTHLPRGTPILFPS